jgi:hypothetical protein
LTHPSLEEDIDKTNPRDTNPWEFIKISNKYNGHKMIPSIDIYEETPLELEKEDYISEYGSYFMNTSSYPPSYEKSPESINVSTILRKIFNSLILPVPKNFERVVIDAYIYHKCCKSRRENLEIGIQRMVLTGEPCH